MLPFVAVSHLVTRREIPYDVPVMETFTRDNVRINIDTLLTFSIVEPHRFVYNISANEFDRVLQASCQDALRTLVRTLTVEESVGLRRGDTTDLKAAISGDVESYGVVVDKIVVTTVQPPIEFVRSQELRQLAIVQRAEQAERQALALQQQADADELTHQKIIAEAEAEALRLARLEERPTCYPAAAEYDWQSNQLNVARSPAGNTRAMLQLGNVGDITRVLLTRDLMRAEQQTSANGEEKPLAGLEPYADQS